MQIFISKNKKALSFIFIKYKLTFIKKTFIYSKSKMLSDTSTSNAAKSQEKVLNIDRKRALWIVVCQSVILISYVTFMLFNSSKFTTVSVVLMSIMVQ